jgi:hypothetical protein
MNIDHTIASNSESKREIKDITLAFVWVLAIFIVGLLFSFMIRWSGANIPGIYYGNYFLYLYVRNEPIILILLIISLFFLRWYLVSSDQLLWAAEAGERLSRLSLRWIWLLALGVLVFAWLGDYWVLHGFPASNDEFAPRFQAHLFLAGKIKVVLGARWRDFAAALTPGFIIFDPAAFTWTSAYLPGYALIRTIFLGLGCASLTGPCLGALSVVLIYRVAQKIWPQDRFAPILAVVLLGSSSQFLIMSMTSFAYPAHLCLNLAWLACYLREDRVGFAVTPWIGFFALGLHNPFVHALFVTPWLVGMVRRRSWKVTLYFALVYLAGCLVWYEWMRFTRPSMVSGEDLHIFQLPRFYQLAIQPMNLSLVFAWQSLAACILFVVAVRHRAVLGPWCTRLLWGCILTFGFFFFFPWDQFIGWGYRFFYGVLGNLVLVAVAGWSLMRQALGEKKALGFLGLTTLLAVCLQLPIRCYQVESFVRPLAASAHYIQSLPEPLVIIDTNKNYLSASLIRNDPFLRHTPKVLRAADLNGARLRNLKKLGKVRILDPAALAARGLPLIPPPGRQQP